MASLSAFETPANLEKIICTLALDSPKEKTFDACPHVVFKKLH